MSKDTTTEKTTTPAKEKTISAEVLAISEIVQKNISINKAGAVTVSEDVYEKTLPESLKKLASEYHKHTSTYIAGVGHAFGIAAQDAMKAHSSLSVVEGVFPAGARGQLISTRVERTSTTRAPGATEETTVHGALTRIKLTVGGKSSLNAVKAHLRERAETMFK